MQLLLIWGLRSTGDNKMFACSVFQLTEVSNHIAAQRLRPFLPLPSKETKDRYCRFYLKFVFILANKTVEMFEALVLVMPSVFLEREILQFLLFLSSNEITLKLILSTERLEHV